MGRRLLERWFALYGDYTCYEIVRPNGMCFQKSRDGVYLPVGWLRRKSFFEVMEFEARDPVMAGNLLEVMRGVFDMVIAKGKERRMVTMPGDLWAWLEVKSREKKWSVSESIEEAVRQWQSRHGSKSGRDEEGGHAIASA